MKNPCVSALILAITLALPACAPSTKAVMETSQSAVALRSFQQRAFDTTDKEKTLRTVISTLQDLSFVVDKADLELGTISATKLSGYQLRMTVTVRPRGETQMLCAQMLSTWTRRWKSRSRTRTSSSPWRSRCS